MGLPTRTLGRDGPKITVLGLGSWAIGGGGSAWGWGPQDDLQSLATMRHAIERGINWIDTAAVYGHGHSEELVGRLLSDLPDSERPLVFTKGGQVWDDRCPMNEEVADLSRAAVRRGCEESLRRLGVECIDLYQFHWPDETGVAVEESWAEMECLIEEGKVRWAGVSNFDVALLERCERQRHVDSLQPHLSLIERAAAANLLPWAGEHGAGVICYSPMESGQLTDSFSLDFHRSLAQNDWRRAKAGTGSASQFSDDALRRNLALRDALGPLAERRGVSIAAVAVAWVIAWSGVTAAIVGARRPEQVDGWIDAADLCLDASELDEIAAAVKATGAGRGPERPR
jgi:aryl-alcohol dehydrogenase-like predicted oxidoreductase